jgi:hypothetical protein
MNQQEFAAYLANLPEQIVETVRLERVAARGVAIIRERTLKGDFLGGTGAQQSIAESNSQYSETPMPLPYGSLPKYVQERMAGREDIKIFTSRKGTVWVVIPGGYKEYRQISGKQSDRVVMNWSGKMMASLGIVTDEPGKAAIGFTDSYAERIASYHNVQGAGKSKRMHRFFGFTAEEGNELTGIAQELLDAALAKL